MNNIAISPKICLYALQNQNVERKIAKQIDIKELQKKSDSTSIDELTTDNKINNEQHIPEILIPKEEPEPLPQNDLLGDTLINNDNLETISESNVLSSNM